MARPSLDALEAFVQIVEAGSLTAAARRMGVAKSVLSERLAALERALDLTLMRRSTRRLALTEAGQRYYAQALSILQLLDEASAEASAVGGREGPLQGRLRIAAPVSFGASHLGAVLMPFLAEHPELECEVDLNDGVVDLLAGHFDFAIRIGRLPDSSLIARRLGDIRRIVCASPEYLARHGSPATPEAIRQHTIIGYSHVGAARLWTFRDSAGKPYVAPTGTPRIVANNGDLVRDAAIAGFGLAILPEFIVGAAIADGRLCEVLASKPPVPDGLHLVYPADRRLPRKTRRALDYFAQALSAICRGDADRGQVAERRPVPRPRT